MNCTVHKLNLNKAIKKDDWSTVPASKGQPLNPKQCDPLSLVHYTAQPYSSMRVNPKLTRSQIFF